ncbi:MAG: membrane protein of unknown function [Promethearchaeota archaeon]|nr:MAG: membrane protein of unknown function [Candidatus Lokiarchaeota archaeon]
MKNKKKLIVLIPLSCLVLAIFSLAVPTVYVSWTFNLTHFENYIWIFGLNYTSFIGFTFLNSYQLLFSLLTTGIIILAIYSLIQNIRYIIGDKKHFDYIKFWLAWIICGTFLLFSVFLYWYLYPWIFAQEITYEVQGETFGTGYKLIEIWYFYFLRSPIFLSLSGLILIISGITFKSLHYYLMVFSDKPVIKTKEQRVEKTT